MEAGAYDQFRELEEKHWWFLGRNAIFSHLVRESIVPKLGLPPGAVRSFDLGCGMGAHLGFLAEHGPATGADLEAACLRHCASRGFRRVLFADGTRLPFADESFDLVTAFDTIEHIPDDRATFRECFRVLRSGGRMFLSGPAWQFLYSHQDRVVHHQRRYTIGSLRKLFAEAGFVVEKASYINFFLFPLILPAVLLLKLKEALRPPAPGDQTTNASVRFSSWSNRLLLWIFAAERHVLTRCSVPLGHSVIVIARKP
jgi:SAM-dependent methyltransferase